MKKIKVFISSIIDGYEDRRDAAEEAIRELNVVENSFFETIRLESGKHPAVNKSPQKACLDGVKECDIYLGIYSRDDYGWEESPVGVSPTHEEFRHAIKENKYCIVLIEGKGKTHPKQKVFLDEVEDYIEGRYRNEFNSGDLSQLKLLVHQVLIYFIKNNFEIYLPTYLSNCRNTFHDIGRPIGEKGSLPINKIVKPELRDELKIENKNSKRHNNKRRKNKNILSGLLDGAIEEYPRLIIVGVPGAGKSTTQKWIAYTSAEIILNSQQREIPVPVYLELKLYNGNLKELVLGHFSTENFLYNEDIIISWIKKGGFIFLLDGLDELEKSLSNKFINELNLFLRYSQNNKFVITSRETDLLKGLKDIGFKEVELMPLANPNIELFIERYLGIENGNKLLNEIKKYNLMTEAKNPLLLWFMILEFLESGSTISSNKALLFKNVLEHRFLEEWDRKHIPSKYDIQWCTDIKVKILSKLSYYMLDENNSMTIPEEDAKVILDDFLKEGRTNYKNVSDKILLQLYESRVLVKSGSQLSFWHKSFQDYFASLVIKESYERHPNKFNRKYMDKKWEESLLFFAGLIDNPSNFVNSLIRPFWCYFGKPSHKVMSNLSLAAKCIGANDKINIDTKQRVREQLMRIIDQWSGLRINEDINFFGFHLTYSDVFFPVLFANEAAIQALVEMKSSEDIELLAERLDEGHIYGQFVVDALQNAPLSQRAQNSLLNAALENRDSYVRRMAKYILRDSMTEETAFRIIDIINNKNEKRTIHKEIRADGKDISMEYSIRALAIEIMGGYHNQPIKYPEISIKHIVKIALEEECEHIRSSAVNVLRNDMDEKKDERIITPLIYALHNDPNPQIRSNAAWALVYHNHPRTMEALIHALDDENAEVLGMVMHVLMCVRPKTKDDENETVNKLLEMFAHREENISSSAIRMYGLIRKEPSDMELSILIDLLKDEHVLIRYRAAEALGIFKEKSALNILKSLIQSEKYILPWSAAIRSVLRIDPSFSYTVKKEGWEIKYILQLYDKDVEKSKIAINTLRHIGTEVSLNFLKEFEEYNKTKKRRDIDNEIFYAIHEIEDRIKDTPSTENNIAGDLIELISIFTANLRT